MILQEWQKNEAQKLADIHGDLNVYWDLRGEKYTIYYTDELIDVKIPKHRLLCVGRFRNK